MTGIILASASTTRQRMLMSAGVEFRVEPPHVDEDGLKAALRQEGATAPQVAEALAEVKAIRVSRRHPGALVIGADQVLDLNGTLLDKPADRQGARAQLLTLRGVEHRLFSAAVAARDGARIWHHTASARLLMRDFSAAFLESYLDAEGDALLGCVGAYRIEGLGIQLFSRVDGDHFTILGLPLLPLLGFLRDAGAMRS